MRTWSKPCCCCMPTACDQPMPLESTRRHRQGTINGQVIGRHGQGMIVACRASIRFCPNRNRTYGFWTPGGAGGVCKRQGGIVYVSTFDRRLAQVPRETIALSLWHACYQKGTPFPPPLGIAWRGLPAIFLPFFVLGVWLLFNKGLSDGI